MAYNFISPRTPYQPAPIVAAPVTVQSVTYEGQNVDGYYYLFTFDGPVYVNEWETGQVDPGIWGSDDPQSQDWFQAIRWGENNNNDIVVWFASPIAYWEIWTNQIALSGSGAGTIALPQYGYVTA